jgi:hypothetical protein
VVHEYSKEDIRKMTEEEVYKAITDDLYVNAFEEQRKNPHKYTGENLAGHCEIIVYECPACKTVGRLHSKGNFLKCDCGYTVEFGEDGLFHAVNGGELLQEDLVAWDHWQRTAVQDILDAYKDNTEEPIFRDEHQTVTRIENDGGKTHLTEDAVLELVCGGLRDCDAIVESHGDDDGAATSVTKKVIAVAEYRSDADCTCAFADGTAYGVDLTCVLITLAVAHHELYLRHLSDGVVKGTILLYHVKHLIFGH